MLVDSSALPEQVVDDVVLSAFQSAGQRCSALRILFVHEGCAERVLALLAGAMRELKVGDPAEPDTDVGPIIDEPARAARSAVNFLWTTFTRFEPAADIHAAGRRLVRNQISFEPPILIDARLKPGFPAELSCAPDVAATVSRRWKEYFPGGGVDMGDSESGHLDPA